MRPSPILLTALLLSLPAQAEAPRVVTDIAPIHSLVSQVMQGVGEPYLLVPGAQTPHGYSMKISQARQIGQSDLVFWVGEGLTPWLEKGIATLGQDSEAVELLDIEGLTLIAFGDEAKGHEDHADNKDHDDHGHDDHSHDDHADHKDKGHDHGAIDPHIWLDPQNARVIVLAVAEILAGRDPENATLYRQNARNAALEIDALDTEIAALMAPLSDNRYVVTHDGYRYFESRYGLGRAIPISDGHGLAPGARRLSEVRAMMSESGARCVFS